MPLRFRKSFFAVFELYWPRGNRVARINPGGEKAGINGFMHTIDNVLIYERDLEAQACSTLNLAHFLLTLLLMYIVFL